MHIYKFLAGTLLCLPLCFTANAQNDDWKKKDLEEKRKVWVNANLYTAQDAVDFITTTYKDFTVLLSKRAVESGIYKRNIKYNDCELIIETESRQQESMWKSDHEFVKDIIVIYMDMAVLDGNDIKPSSPENAKGLLRGKYYDHLHKIPSFSILSGVPNRDNDEKFANLHYEQHLQWAYQFLIDECKGRK